MPPILGGKSLVTSRWRVTYVPGRVLDRPRRLLCHQRVRVVGQAVHQFRKPRRAAAQRAWARTAGPDPAVARPAPPDDLGVGRVRGVAKHDQGVAAQVARLATGDVPPAQLTSSAPSSAASNERTSTVGWASGSAAGR